MSTPGQPPRGDAALRQAIATGSPVATNGKQEAELLRTNWVQSGNEIVCQGVGVICTLTYPNGKPFSYLDINTPAVEDAIGERAALICASPSLHAYAKAEELRHQWINSRSRMSMHEHEYGRHLKAMGWDGVEARPDFLASYRASALAKAGGQ